MFSARGGMGEWLRSTRVSSVGFVSLIGRDVASSPVVVFGLVDLALWVMQRHQTPRVVLGVPVALGLLFRCLSLYRHGFVGLLVMIH
jgi:hypothetical protein